MAQKGAPKTGGRRPGGRNKRTIAADRFLDAGGLSSPAAQQFDPILQMELLAKKWLSRSAAEEKKEHPNPDTIDRYDEKALTALDKMAPYRKPKLATVKVGGDPENPLNLSGLSDSELAFLRRTVAKASGESDGD